MAVFVSCYRVLITGYSLNNACVLVKIGNAHKKVAWDDLEGLIDGFDITEKVANAGDNFIRTLTLCADDFIFELRDVV